MIKKQINIPESIKDFRNFIFYYHKLSGLGEPTKNQYLAAQVMQDCAIHTHKVRGVVSDLCPDRISDRVFFSAFRGWGKSHLIALFCAWTLYRNQETKILVVSGTTSKSSEISYHILKILKLVPELQHLVPTHEDRSGSRSFDVAGIIPKQQPSVACTSVSTNNTGRRAEILILDDVETLSSAHSFAERTSLDIQLQELTGAILSPNALVIAIGTYQSDRSIYLDMIENKNYSTFILPVKMPKADYKYSKYLLPTIEGKNEGDPLDRFSRIEIAKREREYSRESFQLQFMLDTTETDKKSYCFDLGTIPLVNTTGPNKIMCIDPAAGGGDASAYTVLSYGDGKITIHESGDCGGYSDDSMRVLLNCMKSHKITEVHVEKNFGAGMFSLLLQKFINNNNYKAKVIDFTSSGNKENRITETLQPSFQQNLIAFNSSYYDIQDNPRSLRYQLKYFNGEKDALEFDDAIDCLASGVQIIKSSAVIPDKALTRMEQARAENEMRRAIYGTKFTSNFITNRM